MKTRPAPCGLLAAGLPRRFFSSMAKCRIHYFTAGQFEGQELVSGNVVADTILTGVTTCHTCVIACGRRVIIPDGPYARPESKGPEWETMMGFGSVIGSSDMSAATHVGQLCDAYGLDTISASNTIGLAYLLYQRGFLPEADLDGLRLAWGDPRPAEALVNRIVSGEGIGAFLRVAPGHWRVIIGGRPGSTGQQPGDALSRSTGDDRNEHRLRHFATRRVSHAKRFLPGRDGIEQTGDRHPDLNSARTG